MKTTTRLVLSALLVAALALFTAGTAFAGKLRPPPNSDSNASGSARTWYDGPYSSQDSSSYIWFADTKFRVKGLQPNTLYVFSVSGYSFEFQTDNIGEAADTVG